LTDRDCEGHDRDEVCVERDKRKDDVEGKEEGGIWRFYSDAMEANRPPSHDDAVRWEVGWRTELGSLVDSAGNALEAQSHGHFEKSVELHTGCLTKT
jgi:hypothetical protein